MEVVVLLFGEDCADVVYSGAVVLLPYLLNFGGGLLLDEGDLHDLPEFPGAGVGEGHLEERSIGPHAGESIIQIVVRSQVITVIVLFLGFIQDNALLYVIWVYFDGRLLY